MASSKGMHWRKWSLARRATACVMAAVLVFTLAWPGISPHQGVAYTGSGGTDVSSSNHTIVSKSEGFVNDSLALKLNYNKLVSTENIGSGYDVKKKDVSSSSTNVEVFYIDNSDNFTEDGSKNKKSTWSSLGAKLNFENVCTIGGVKVDATVTIQRVEIGKHKQYTTGNASTSSFLQDNWETEDGSKVGIAYVTGGGLWLGVPHTNSLLKGYAWVAQRDVKVKVTLKWDSDLSGSVDLGDVTAEAGKTVDLDFYTYITDIDVNNNSTEEMWTYSTDDGFRKAQEYRTAYSNTVLKQKVSTSDDATTRTYWHYRKGDVTENEYGYTEQREYDAGDGSETACGVYTQTNGGEFTSTFSVSLCAMKLTAYSQYDAVEGPEKFIYKPGGSADFQQKSQEYAGGTITWYVTQKMGKAWDNTTQPYSAMRIVDDLPTSYVTFSKAVMYRGKKKDVAANSTSDITKLATITSSSKSATSTKAKGSGTLEYDSGTVRFIFDSDWLEDMDNYEAQIYTMVITVTIKSGVSTETEIVNSATTKINGVPYDSNEVVTTIKASPTPTLSLTKTTYNSSASAALTERTLTSKVSATLTGYESEWLWDDETEAYLVWTRLSGSASSGAWIQWDLNSSLTFYFQLAAAADAEDYVCAVVDYVSGGPDDVAAITYVDVYILDYEPKDYFTEGEDWSTKTSVSSLQTTSPATVLTTTAGGTSAKWVAYNSATWWRIEVTASDADAENVEVTDTVPSYLKLSSASVITTSDAEGEKVASVTTGAGGSFTVTADSLQEDATLVVWCKTTLVSSSYLRRNITNTAYATCDDWDGTASASDTVAYYASGTYTVTKVPTPELSITKEADVEETTQTAGVDYDDYSKLVLYDDFTIVYVQLSSALAANKSVTMRIGTYTAVTFAFDEAVPSGSYLFYCAESADYSGTVYALSSLSGASAMELSELVGTAFSSADATGVTVSSKRGVKYVKAGEVVKWIVTAENTGDSSSTASSTVVTDTVPEGLTLLTSSGYYPTAKKGSSSLYVSTSGNTWTTTSTSLSYGGTITVTFYTTVDEGYAWQVLRNTATASASNASSVSASDWVMPYEPDGPTKYQKTIGWDENASDLEWSNGNSDEASAVLARYDDIICYRIEQGMPMLAYDAISFEDTLPAELEYVSMSIYVDDVDVTSRWSVTVGDWSSNGTAISATCGSPSSSWFSESSLLAFEIECNIAEDAEVGYFHNTATVAFDSTSNETNEVWTNLWLATQHPDISITKTAEVEPHPEGVYSESDYVALAGYDGTSSSSGSTSLYLYKALPEALDEGAWVCWQPGYEEAVDNGLESASGTYWFQVPASMAAGQWVALGWDADGDLTWEVTAFSELPEGGTGTSLGTAETASADVKYVEVGTSFWWSITVEEGNEYATAGHVVVSDTVPSELSYVSGTLSSTLGTASFDESTNAWTVDLGEPGQLGEYVSTYSFEVRFQTTALTATDDPIVNTALVTADDGLSAEASDEVDTYYTGELPKTGSVAMRALGATAAVAAFAGACVAVHARRRRRQREALVRNFHRV